MIRRKTEYESTEQIYSDASAQTVTRIDPNCMSLREILEYSLNGNDPSGFFGIGKESYEFKNESEEEIAIDNDYYDDMPESLEDAQMELERIRDMAYLEAAERKASSLAKQAQKKNVVVQTSAASAEDEMTP